jgi:hypothetical protein
MTDYEYTKLMILFDQKHMDETDIDALDRWVTSHGHSPPHWGTPQQLIEILEEWPDR